MSQKHNQGNQSGNLGAKIDELIAVTRLNTAVMLAGYLGIHNQAVGRAEHWLPAGIVKAHEIIDSVEAERARKATKASAPAKEAEPVTAS